MSYVSSSRALRKSGSIEKSLAQEEKSDEQKSTEKLHHELRRRVRILYGEIQAWTGESPEGQKEQMRFLGDAMRRLEPT